MHVRQYPGPKPNGSDVYDRANRLTGWKAIGHFLDCTARTARRWEASRALPVHRVPGEARDLVWAAPDELIAWLNSLPHQARIDLRAEETTADGGLALDPAAGALSVSPTPVSSTPSDVPAEERGAAQPTPEPAAPVSASSAMVEPAGATPELPPAVSTTSGTRRNLVVAAVAAVLLMMSYATWRLSSARFAHRAMDVASKPYHGNPEATALYQKARFELATRTAEGLTLAQQDFRHLTEQYPRSAAGWSGLADSYLLLREFGAVAEAQAYPEAARAARAAIALDPNSADAWLDVAFVAFWWEGDTVAGLHAFETALKLEPRSARAFHWYATALSGIGDFDKSLTMIARARELDPGNRAIVADEGWILFSAGRRGEGLTALESLVLVDPKFVSPHHYLSRAYLIMSRDQDFLREAMTAAQLRGQTDVVANLRLAEAAFLAGGRRALLDQLSKSATEAWRKGDGSAVFVAAYRALANDRA